MYKEALNLLKLLDDKGYESYIIGGYVRDKLLNIKSDDIDIVTKATPNELSSIFNKELKDNFGSVKLNFNNYKFDVTTFRKDNAYLDKRRPSNVEYVSTLKEDVLRRDFTINAIAIDKDGNYIDILGGIEDINNKVIRCIGIADTKLKEDALRILRALRFASIYGFNLDEELKESISKNKDLISNLSFDRIKKELDIIFSSSKANLFFDMVNYFDLGKTLQIEPKNGLKITNNYLSIWAQLKYSNMYNFSNYEKRYIDNIRNILSEGINSYTVYKYDRKVIDEANKILNIDNIDDIYNNLTIRSRKDINITYDEILSVVKDKSKINKIYIDLEKQILYNKLINKREDIISYLEGDIIE